MRPTLVKRQYRNIRGSCWRYSRQSVARFFSNFFDNERKYKKYNQYWLSDRQYCGRRAVVGENKEMEAALGCRRFRGRRQRD